MPATDSYIAPVCVFGGFQIAEIIETRTPDGVEVDYDVISATKYPTFAACLAAIAALQARALARVAA